MCGHLKGMQGSPMDYYWVPFIEKMFKQRLCVPHSTFSFLCERLGRYLQRIVTHMREAISIESRIVMSLQRFEIENTLCIVGEVYRVAESINF